MNPISKEEYIALLEQLADEQYGDDSTPELTIQEESWIPAEPYAKERMKAASVNGTIDVTKFRKDKIQEALYKCVNIKIGIFLIRIEGYHGYPDKLGKGTNLTMDIAIWEEKYTTPTGNPCKMTYRVDFFKDNRFYNRPWLNYFNTYGKAHNMPVETVVEVIRWLQAIKRMTAFL